MSKTEVTVTLEPTGRRVRVRGDSSLLEAAARAGITIDTPCGGSGTCGKCRVRFVQGGNAHTASDTVHFSTDELQQGYRLACQCAVTRDVVVDIPASSVLGAMFQILETGDSILTFATDSGIHKQFVSMPSPSLQDDAADLLRIERALIACGALGQGTELIASANTLRCLGAALREAGFQGTVTLRDHELLDFESGDTTREMYALAFDIGTTTLVGALLSLETGAEIAVASCLNPQTAYGDDVLSRISFSGRNPDALETLRRAVLSAVARLTEQLCIGAGVQPEHIYRLAFAGNTTMQHLLCGFDPVSLGAVPFVPVYNRALTLRPEDLSLHVHPEAHIQVFPVIGGFVGGDTVAGMLAVGLNTLENPVLLVDIGTNGEIVLVHNDEIHAASTAAGPAFEGARISCGMRAAEGAIEKVSMNDDIEYSVIGEAAPAGICGSGLIDLCALLLDAGVLLPDGRLLLPESIGPEVPSALAARLRAGANGEPEFIIHDAPGMCLSITQKDIRELQLGVGAIRAGIRILLKQAGLKAADVKQVLIAGGFGSFIRRNHAQRIGLIPEEIPHPRIRHVGNVSLSGAKRVVASLSTSAESEQLALRTRHVELSQDPDFAMEFAMAMYFPVRS